MFIKTLLAATASLALFGPPRIAVQTTNVTGNAVAIITADYHTEEADARVYGTLHTIASGQRATRAIALEKLDAHRYRVPRSWTTTEPVVVVVGVEQGEKGKHGVAEGMIRVARGGSVAGVDIPTERTNGHNIPRRITDREIDAAFLQLGVRAAD
jgi:hypothetical protein